MVGFDPANYVLDSQPISVVMMDGEAIPAEVHSFTNIAPSHYAWTPQQPENTYERGDGSQGIWVGGIRGNLDLTVSEQDPTLLDTIQDEVRTIIVTNTKTGKTLTLTSEAKSIRCEQAGGEAIIHIHSAGPQGGTWASLFVVV